MSMLKQTNTVYNKASGYVIWEQEAPSRVHTP